MQNIAAGNTEKEMGAPIARAAVRQFVPIWGRQWAKDVKGF
jgi:hypothetical protein